MVKLNKNKNQMEITLDHKPGRQIASSVLQMIWIYCCQTEEDRAIVTQMNRMVHGYEEIQDVDLMDYTEKGASE